MSAAALQKPRPATLEELLALPGEGQGYEIIDGELRTGRIKALFSGQPA